MSKFIKYFLLISLLTGGFNLFYGTSAGAESYMQSANEAPQQPKDSTPPRYAVKKTQITTFEDLSDKPPIDLRNPSNVKTEVEYDIKNNVYLFRTKIGDQEWTTPFSMTQSEYNAYTLKESMTNYFRIKNNEILEKGTTTDDHSLKDIKISLGPAEKIFGPGGVKIRPQGYVEFSAGIKHSTNDRPTLSEKKKATTIFDVNQKIQLSVNASIGDKMNFDLNYDTEATFDFDSKKLKLAYEGKEDEIIKYLEAGNVSLNTTNSLIQGANSLFGIRADLQFGKLKINTVISQQESETKTVGSKGGVQTTPFQFSATDYEENRHFFLGHYFRDRYDKAAAKLPYVDSPVSIDKMEVWVTNKRGNFDQARNIVAFADLAEHSVIKNSHWKPFGTDNNPYNKNNTLYEEITSSYKAFRDINQVNSVLSPILTNGLDFEKIESARLLTSTEYTYSPLLGYISLNFMLQPDEVLAVAYTYKLNGRTYQVGELAADISDKFNDDGKSGALLLKLLKPVSLSPASHSWHLMMKNIYSLGAYQIQSDRFRLNISYQNDTTGTYINYLPDGDIKNKLLIKVMNLDRLNSRLREVKNADGEEGDGIFDFVEGYTIKASNGRIIFPVKEPFGEHLRVQIGNDSTIAKKYVYQELYDSTLTVAKQVAEKNKFRISGSYKASNTNEIDLGTTNVVPGSVKVTAGGVILSEGSDYTVDYISGRVTITNQNIIDAGTSISATVENRSQFNMQRKTMLGLNLSYEFSKNFNIGATVLHMYEKPLTTKAAIGSESLKNTLIGFNTSYRTESQWLTNLLDKIPFVEATQPSQITFNGEFAQMLPGHYKSKYAGGYSYLDDFETSRSKNSLRDPYAWALASTPSNKVAAGNALFPEASSDKLDYGMNRALLAWYTIDNMFTRKNSSLTPQHIKNDKEQLSSHFVREVRVSELYPNRDAAYNETATIPTLNLSYYPEQRGPYNLDATKVTTDGKLKDPEKRWGGISRKLDGQDFEATNVEYIEFWMMDPFVYNDKSKPSEYNKGGHLYFNLGEISEDILKDGRKFYENGLPELNDTTLYEKTIWGRVPKRQSTVYAFDKETGAQRAQDVGFNGLITEDEFEFPAYKKYLEDLRVAITDPAAIAKFEADLHSPFNDPSGDNFHHFRGSDYDRDEVSILDRYKYINGTERNTVGSGKESYSTSIKTAPDVEDLDQNYTLNETESYFQYKIDLDPDKMIVGSNSHIAEIKEVPVNLPNGQTEKIKWYQFKIPIREDYERIGTIRDFKSIRYMRMFLTNFEKTTHLRFGSLDLVKGEWRTYTQSLQQNGDESNSVLNVTSVNIEENGNKEPVNYVLPPGESRILDPGQPQLRQENEQALSLQVIDLESEKRRAVYKNTTYDLRRYKRLQMFTHAESLIGEEELKKGDLAVFMRLGTDYKNNYYEYEIPLTITPAGEYIGTIHADQLAVWPTENMFDFRLEVLKDLKVQRNKEKRKTGSGISFTSLFHGYDPEKPNNRISVIGNPSLAEVNVIMIGVRNKTRNNKSGEIWINELRLTDFDEEGGWAAQGGLNIALSDIGTLQFTGRKETAGFGSIEQSLMQRRADDFHTYSIAASVDLGRFIPEKVKAVIPMYYTYTNETTTPKYDPFDQDVLLSESLSAVSGKAAKDSIRDLARDKTVNKSFSISGAKINVRSKNPMPYDPANFSFGYAQSSTETKNPTTVYDNITTSSATFNYAYSPMVKTWKPFEKSKSKAPMSKFTKALGFNYLPNNIAVSSNINRYYTETVIRDLDSYMLGGDNSNKQFLSFSSNFFWDRDFNLAWDFTKNLKFSIQTGTKAEIEEPYLQVNKKLNPDQYDEWKDAVERSIMQFGRPLSFRQTTNVTYNLPFSDIPYLDWINSAASYTSTYNWDRGASTDDSRQIGNALGNSMTISLNSRFNMLSLYNKSAFLKKVNQRFQTGRSNIPRPMAGGADPRKRNFEKTVSLSTDSATVIVHNLSSKSLEVIARREDNNRPYAVKIKRIDPNTIKITTKDSIRVKVNIRKKGDSQETAWENIAQYTARGLMSLRNFSVNYSRRNENSIYGFRPDIGDFFGQSSSMVPGMGFAFGFDGGEEFIDKALGKGWMVLDSSNITPAIFNKMEKLDFKAQLEPIRGLRIDLTASREKNDQTSLTVLSGNNKVYSYGGSFSMSINSLSSAFESFNAKNDYQSKAFDQFLKNRDAIADRVQGNYIKNVTPYPNAGFIQDLGITGKYDPDYGVVNKNSSDVLIPAFLAAYTGKSVKNVALSPFLALSSIVPSWSITYDGLTTLPWFKDKFKSFKIIHGYTSRYQIGNYSSHSSWVGDGNWGFIQNNINVGGSILPSSPYNINSVTIVEQFNPLFGAEGTMNNNLTIRAKYNRGRSLSLNVSSYQIVESRQNELVIGAGYRINEFNRIIGLTSKGQKGFNNDLNITADLSNKTNQSLLRKIEEGYSQATSGVTITTIKISADYAMSKSLTLRAYFDKVINNPLISSSAYPTTETNFGLSIRFTLTQ